MDAASAQQALAHRLTAVARTLHPQITIPADLAGNRIALAGLLDHLLGGKPDNATTWLLLTAISSVYPQYDTVQHLRRRLDLLDHSQRADLVLREGLTLLHERGNPCATLEIVQDEWVVDVNFCARFEYNTGIQRVVRNTVPHWLAAGHRLCLVAWGPHDRSYRVLTGSERDRVLAWDTRVPVPVENRGLPTTVVVPWNTTVVIPEVPTEYECKTLASLAQCTGNRVVGIGYDCIPVVCADLLHLEEPNRFVHYLRLLKYADRVVGISASAAREFAGFAGALPTQGLAGPVVNHVLLPEQVPDPARRGQVTPADPPHVVCIGSHEPRKNHNAVLYAAEVLWREGHRFTLRLIGGRSGDDHGFADRVADLQEAGRPLTLERGVRDADLWTAYRQSRFTIFPSLHEGYGLPVAESLTLGVPVITTGYGSTAEVAEGGGALLVDPRDDDDMVDAMRRLLTDDELHAALVAAAQARPRRTWPQYAAELWEEFAVPAGQTQGAQR